MPPPLDHGPRASGRTYRMIMALPVNAIVLVPNIRMECWLRPEIDEHRGTNFPVAGIWTAHREDDVILLRSIAHVHPIRADHTFWDNPHLIYATGRQVEYIIETQAQSDVLARPTDERRSRSRLNPASFLDEMSAYLPTYSPPTLANAAVDELRRRARRNRGPQTYNGPEAEDL